MNSRTDMAPASSTQTRRRDTGARDLPKIDSRTAGFSPVWIGKLRDESGFDGVVFSDDLSMQAAGVAGDIVGASRQPGKRAATCFWYATLTESVGEGLERWHPAFDPVCSERIGRLVPQPAGPDAAALRDDPRYVTGVRFAQQLAE